MRLSLLSLVVFFSLVANAQQPALLINRIFTNPSGNDSPFELVELVATRTINFTTEPFTVVAGDGSNASASGWASGGTGSYAFQINSGTAAQGDLIYVGGSSMVLNGSSCKTLRLINTGTTAGDGFGSASSTGVIGNGGSNADGIAVFNVAASTITATTVPIDALFFGSAAGSAATKNFQVPVSDLYSGGVFGSGSNTFLAPDPVTGDYIYTASGVFYTNTFAWGTPRSFSLTQAVPNCNSSSNISFQPSNSLELSFNNTATSLYINPPYISGVIGDPTDPAATLGVVVNVRDNNVDIPAGSYTLSAYSPNTAVVTNANVSISQFSGSATIKILPTGVGYSTITLTLTKSSLTKTLVINYAASAAATSPANTRWHTGFGDASAAIALDDNYMVIADDESNKLFVHHRTQSGLYVTSFFYGDLLSLTDGTPGNYKEVDVEAGVKSPSLSNRSYWLGSMSNSSSFNDKPNRNRLFATDITGTGAATSFSYIGKYSNLRSQLISWGDSYGYNFTSSAADGKDPKAIDGFNIEGMTFGPNGTTLYIAFRAPLVPTSSRTKGVIAPILNFEAWFNNGSPSGNPVFGAPIELNLGGRGFRDIVRLSNGLYIIAAGSYDGTPNGAVYKWTGNAGDQPVLLNSFNILPLNVECVVELNESGSPSGNKLQVISDDGSSVWYNDGLQDKDLTQLNFKKYRSDIITGPASVLPVTLEYFYIQKKERATCLNWKVTNEQPLNYEIQRSLNGIEFRAIATIRAGNTLNYTFTDTAHTGKICYRIRMQSADGQSMFSSIRMVNWSAGEIANIYPNPVTWNELTVSINTPGKKQASVFDSQGKLYQQVTFTGNSNVINTHGWVRGSYTIVVSVGDDVVTRTVLVK
jgi:hypothetical protein